MCFMAAISNSDCSHIGQWWWSLRFWLIILLSQHTCWTAAVCCYPRLLSLFLNLICLGLTASPLQMLSVHLVIVIASSKSTKSYTTRRKHLITEGLSHQHTIRPWSSITIICHKKPSLILFQNLPGASKAVIAAVFKKYLGHFRILFDNSAWNTSNSAMHQVLSQANFYFWQDRGVRSIGECPMCFLDVLSTGNAASRSFNFPSMAVKFLNFSSWREPSISYYCWKCYSLNMYKSIHRSCSLQTYHQGSYSYARPFKEAWLVARVFMLSHIP